MKSIKAIFRRGQQTSRVENPTHEDISRSSSVTNLNVDHKAKGAKPKKSESKDKLDKLSEKKHEKNRALTKNNNKESRENVSNSLTTDVEALQKQLAQMANDKTSLALQLGEQTGQLNSFQKEISKLKMWQDDSAFKLEQLTEENKILRNRLRDVSHSPLSDNEKQQLLYDAHRHSSAPASIATTLLDDVGDITACPTPEWDKHSSSNVSEVSVACLQDKINQMQETHYSTNEELQATVQELTDLQRQLTELQQENLRLNDEKNLMFESLCRQTERLNDSRNEVESLKQLLYKDETGQFESAAEREQKLVDLLKSAQEERETLLVKQEQLGNDLEDSRSVNLLHNDEITQLTERVRTLESTVDAKHAEHKQLDQELAQAKDQSSSRQIEINRLKDLLENARTKIIELEQDRALSDKSELDELLDNARKEKDSLESEVAHLKEQLALSKNEVEKFREQVSVLQEECKVTRNNAKTTQSDLEYKLERVLSEKSAIAEQLQQFQEAMNELQVQAQCQLDDKRQLSAVLSETQRNLNESERKIVELESELGELKRIKQEEEEEWEKFQSDLLTSVRVANDFKTEAQQDLQKLILENKAGREKIKLLEGQIDKLKGESKRKSVVNKSLTSEERLMSSLQRRYNEIANLTPEQLTDEQRAVKDLKLYFEKTPSKKRPVAHKPKSELAISKPSLNSVISDPKLGRIVANTRLQDVETPAHFWDDTNLQRRSNFSDVVDDDGGVRMSQLESVSQLADKRDDAPRKSVLAKVQSESGVVGIARQSIRDLLRRKSLSDLPQDAQELPLRRYGSTENLLSLTQEQKHRKKTTVTLATLKDICDKIQPNTPERELTKEQRLALKLKKVLINGDKKVPLKKKHKVGRSVVISRPTKESVEKNDKLLEIIENPIIQSVSTRKDKAKLRRWTKDRYSMPVFTSARDHSTGYQKSKSCNDITFNFEAINMYSEDTQDLEIDAISPDSVLPPEEFRDPSPPLLRSSTAFITFSHGTNTYQKGPETDQEDCESVTLQDLDADDTIDTYSYDQTIDCESVTLEDVESEDTIDAYPYELTIQDAKDEQVDLGEAENHYQQTEPVEVVANDNYLDVLSRRLEEDDFLRYDLDEEELRARRGARKRFSSVIDEFRDKFETIDEDASSMENAKYGEDLFDSQAKTMFTVDGSKGDEQENSVETHDIDQLLRRDNESRNGEAVDFNKEEQNVVTTSDDVTAVQEEDNKYSNVETTLTVDQKEPTVENNVESDFTQILTDDAQTLSFGDYIEDSDIVNFNNNVINETNENAIIVNEQLNEDQQLIAAISSFARKTEYFIEKEREAELLDIAARNYYFSKQYEKAVPPIAEALKDQETYKSDGDKKKLDIVITTELFIKTEREFELLDIAARNYYLDKHYNDTQMSRMLNSTESFIGTHSELKLSDIVTRNDKKQELNDIHIINDDAVQAPHDFYETLTDEEVELLRNLPQIDRSLRPLSDINQEDLRLVEELCSKYGINSTEETSNGLGNETSEEVLLRNIDSVDGTGEDMILPSFLSPSILQDPTTYEPVYANYHLLGSQSKIISQPVTTRKPKAAPRIHSWSTSTEDIYEDLGGQVRKTRFSITYQKKSLDCIDGSREKPKVKALTEMFERKSLNDSSTSVSRKKNDDN